MNGPDFSSPWYQQHVIRLCLSYFHWTGKLLIPNEQQKTSPVKSMFESEFVLVSHGTDAIPVFNFANDNALKLFEMSWEEFIRLPSKYSADDDNQADRAELMQRVSRDGYADDCRGIRISSSGKRFLIEGATVWNVIDDQQKYYGQAAMFTNWKYL